jgi:hypothetical protein
MARFLIDDIYTYIYVPFVEEYRMKPSIIPLGLFTERCNFRVLFTVE